MASDGESILDRESGFPRLLADKCETCIFRPGNLMHLRPGRVKEMTEGAVADGSFITCHSTLPGMSGEQAAVCRGFYDAHGHRSNLLRVFLRLGGFTEVKLPAKEVSDAQ